MHTSNAAKARMFGDTRMMRLGFCYCTTMLGHMTPESLPLGTAESRSGKPISPIDTCKRFQCIAVRQSIGSGVCGDGTMSR
jgi:hypothetical protein